MLTRIKQYTFNLGAIALTLTASAIAVNPSLAQTTSVPITGGNFSVNVTSAGAVSNPTGAGITVLTPVGTAQITSLTGTTLTSTPLTTNGAFDIQGTSTNGSVNFDDGRTSTFTNAQSTIKGSISTVNGATPSGSPVSALASPATVAGLIKTGSSIQVPTSSISALPANTVIVPITSGTFDVVRFSSTTVVNNSPTTILTPYGTAQLTKFEYATIDNLNGSNVFNVNDEVRSTALASGSIPTKVSTFTNAKAAVIGTVTTTSLNSNSSVNLKGNITSGNLIVPASSTTALPTVSNESILILLNNRQLFKLVGLSPSFLASSKTKFLLVLVNNQSLLNYVESKSTEVSSTEPLLIGNSNAVDSLVFLSFQKTVLFPAAYEVALTRPVYVVGKIPPGQLKKQRVVFVGMGSRLMPEFGVVSKVENDD